MESCPRRARDGVPRRPCSCDVLDSDLEGKSTLSLLQELFNIQVRGGAGEQSVPVLTPGVGRRRAGAGGPPLGRGDPAAIKLIYLSLLRS
jgi:hypothetical protein